MDHIDLPKENNSLAFRRACGLFPTGVAIATRIIADSSMGITVNSFSSVSWDPPSVLICVHRLSRFLRGFEPGEGFAVNILSAAQQDLSARFASRSADRSTFGPDWDVGVLGVPVHRYAAAAFECELQQAVESGDHSILIGSVLGMHQREHSDVLVFHRGHYSRLESERGVAAGV